MADGSALGFVRVLDLSESIAGQFCCRMLADYGADVLLVEPPGGSCLRTLPPLLDESGQGSESLQFLHLNLGKRSVTVDTTTDEGRRALLALAENADVLVVPPGFDRSAIKEKNARCIVAVVSPFGEDGPRARWLGSEMVYQALSGSMTQNGRGDREPLYGVGERASFSAGIASYVAVLAALMARERSGIVQEVAVDVAHNAASMTYPFALQYSYNGSFERRGQRGTPLLELQCRDSYVSIWVRPAQFRVLLECLDALDLVDDPRFAALEDRTANFPKLAAELQERVLNRDATELVARLQSRRVVAACCFHPSQLTPQAPHLAERGYWQVLGEGGDARHVLGAQFRMSRTPRRPVRQLVPADPEQPW